jgi:hypothetical protein
MSARTLRCAALVVSGALALSAAGAPAPREEPDTSPAAALYRRADFRGFDDPKTTLEQALDKIGRQYGVRFAVNERAFRFEAVPDVLKTEIAETPLPAMKNARLDAVLKCLRKRVVVNSDATYMVRRELIEITTERFRNAEIWGLHGGPFLPPVSRNFKKVPLDKALEELAELAEFNIVLDLRTGESGKAPVTARFLNTPLDTAVQFLADMADLRSLQRDNLLYVTSKENATAWQNRFQKERKLDDQGDVAIVGGGPRLGAGRGLVALRDPTDP